MSERKIVFTEEEMLELVKDHLRPWRQKLAAAPESPDHIALLQAEQHFLRRLDEIAMKRYRREKGLE